MVDIQPLLCDFGGGT